MKVDEFDLIETYFKPLSTLSNSSEVSIGDDGAVLNLPSESQLVVVMDTLIEGVHFPKQTTAYDIAWKSLAVNLSDLAAMGAKPAFFTLALSLPEAKNHQAWLEGFAKGLEDLAQKYQLPLVGGDTTRSELLVITITAHGWIASGESLLRKQAQAGDLIYVSGQLGQGGLGLKAVLNNWSNQCYKQERQALNRPEPRVALGQALKKYANSAIDVSDGLLADLKHLLSASCLGAELDYQRLPMSSNMKLYREETKDWLLPMVAGDDYELCFTITAENQDNVKKLAGDLDISLTCIGHVVAEKEVFKIINTPDSETDLNVLTILGYQHF